MKWVIVVVVLVLIYILHQKGLKALPKHLKYCWHWDYFFPFCFISRTLTSLTLTQPPRLIAGSKHLEWAEKTYKDGVKRKGPEPRQHIAGAWALTWPLHLTFTVPWKKDPEGKPQGLYVRLGIRWDTVDDYYTTIGAYRQIIPLKEKQTYVNYRGDARI